MQKKWKLAIIIISALVSLSVSTHNYHLKLCIILKNGKICHYTFQTCDKIQPCKSPEECNNPPAGFHGVTSCAVSSFEEWKSNNGFCYYGPKLTKHFLQLGKGTCFAQLKACLGTNKCCPGLNCEGPDDKPVCLGDYDENYIKKLQFPKKPV